MADEPCEVFTVAGVECPFLHDTSEGQEEPEHEDDHRRIPIAVPGRKEKEGIKGEVSAQLVTIMHDFREAEQDAIPRIAAQTITEQGWQLPFNQSPLSLMQNVLIILSAYALRRLVGSRIKTRSPRGVLAQRQLISQLSQPRGTSQGSGRSLGARGRGGFLKFAVLDLETIFGGVLRRKVGENEDWQSFGGAWAAATDGDGFPWGNWSFI